MTDDYCQVCQHPAIGGIDVALALGERSSVVAADFDLTPAQVGRHAANHLTAEYTAAREATRGTSWTAEPLTPQQQLHLEAINQQMQEALGQLRNRRDGDHQA